MRSDLTDVGRRVLVLGIAIMLLTPAGMGMATAEVDDGAVSAVRTVDEVRAHLAIAQEHLAEDRRDMAVPHAEAILEEQWPIVRTDLSDVNETLATDLESALAGAESAARNDTATEFETLVREDLTPLLDLAEGALVAESQATDPTFNAKVVSGLLERAGAEYQEGVTESGEIAEDMDYWAAAAFADQAGNRYETHIRPTLDEHATEELDEMFETLGIRIDDRAAPDDVTTMTGSITGELGEYTGMEVKSGGEGAEAIERIEADLHEAVEAYEAGNESDAKSIISNTYLSNFEGVEGALIENDPDLVEELEADFNERLPGLIDEGASVDEVRQKVESMEERLHEAEEILAAQEDTEIDLGAEEENGSSGTEETTEASDPGETTGTTTPGFGLLGALIALGLIAAAGYRRQ